MVYYVRGLLVSLVCLSGCTSNIPNPEASYSKEYRMYVRDKMFPFGNTKGLYIISVDGREYLVNENGGIVKHERPN